MLTVKEIFASLSRNELIDAYAKIERILFLDFDQVGAGQMTYAKLKKSYRRSLGDFLDLLLQTPVKKTQDERMGIIFGFPDVKTDEAQHEFVYLDELVKYRENTEAYAYSFTDWEEVLGFFVADTRYTQEHIEEIMAQVMWEMSWWGFTADAVRKSREKMYQTIDELHTSEEFSNQNHDEEDEPLPSRIVRRMKPPQDFSNLSKRKMLEQEYYKAWDDYQNYLRGEELLNVIKVLPASMVKKVTQNDAK